MSASVALGSVGGDDCRARRCQAMPRPGYHASASQPGAATGTADIDYDPASKKLSWKLNYSGLSGPATAAHFHGPAEAGKNAGVAVAIPNATSSPVDGSATLTDAQAADLVAGKYYINVHTAANPGGEIRGQVTK